MKLMTATKDIEAAIASIASRGKKLDQDIQLAGLSVLAHIGEHGDNTLVNKLYAALSKGARKAAMTEWLVKYGRVVANTADNKKEQPFIFDKSKTTDMAGASAEPWYDCKPDAAPDQVFDGMKLVLALLAKAGKASEVKDADLIEDIRQLVEKRQTEEAGE